MNKEQMKQKLEDIRYTAQNKWEDVKHGFRKVKEVVGEAAEEHPLETLSVGVTLIVACIGGATKLANASAQAAENYRRETDFYDPRTGRHVHSKRKLTKSQSVLVDERYANGESYASILNELNLLK